MSFATPWMLTGLIAVVIPIWLHFRPRREVVVLFPAALILAKVARQRKRQLKLRALFLLAARILAVIAVVLAASRPGLKVERPGGIRSGEALAQVIVVDNSLSMQLTRNDGTTLFDRAKELSLKELGRLRPGDAAALVLSGRPIRLSVPEVDFDLRRVRNAVKTLQPGFSKGDPEGALRAALRILEESPLPTREVVFITDLSDGGAKKQWPPLSFHKGIGFRVLDTVIDNQRDNRAVDSVRVSPSPEGVAREVLIEARITNHGDVPIKGLDVILEVDGVEVAQGSVDLPPRESATKQFFHRFGSDGMHRGLVRINKDRLPKDDVRYFSAIVRQAISVLVINGDYRPGSYRDEAFYLHRALETPMPGEVPIQPVVVDMDAAQAGPLAGSEVVFLAGARKLSPVLANRLIAYVKGGGGLFIAPAPFGRQLQLIESILPAKIRSIRHASRPDRPFRVAAINRSHPLFEPFGAFATGLEKTKVRAHLLVEPEPSASRNTLVELADGLPLLLERRVGKGIVMFLTTTIDRDWTDFPIRPGYLPLIQRATRHLAGRLDDREPRRVLVGQPLQIEVSEGMQRLVIRGPNDKDTTYPARELAGRSEITFKATDFPGHYQVWAEIPVFGGLKELFALGFVVATDPAESNLKQVIKALDKNDPSNFAPVKGTFPIWPYLLVVLVILLLIETWLSSQGLKRSHIRASDNNR